MPEKTFWTLVRKSWIALFQGLNPTKVFPKFSLALAISTWPKEMRWVYTLGNAGWISTFVVLNWQVWMCWSLLILGSSLLAERYGIRFRNESARAKKHRIISREKTSFFRSEKMTFFRAEKMAFFRTPNRTSWTTQKAQCKNITRKRKYDEKYIRENSPKKWLFLEFCFAPALARPKKRNYFAQSRFPKYCCFFDVRGQKNGKNSTPSAMGETPWSKYVSAERKNVFGRNPQKNSFFWDFSKLKLRKREFPRLFVI